MKRLLSKESPNRNDAKAKTPYSPVSLKFSNRKSGTSSASGETLSMGSDYMDYPLENRKPKSPTSKKMQDVKKRVAVKSPNRKSFPPSTTMYSMLSASSLDLQKLSPKFSKAKDENVVATKLRKAAHNLVENDDLDALLKLIEDYKSTSAEVKEVVEKEKWTLESNIFNDRKTNMNLLHTALEDNKKKCADYMLNNFSISYLLQTYTNIDCQIPPSCKSCLHIIVEKGDKEHLELLLTKLRTTYPKMAETYQAMLIPFAENNNIDKVSDYVNLKVVLKIIEGKRRLSPVHLAVINGHHHLLDLMAKFEFEMDAEDDFRETPLMWAIMKKNEEAFHKLLSLGADVNHVNQYSCSPLHMAVTNNQPEMAIRLIDKPETDLNIERIKNPRWVIENVAFHNYHQLMKKLLENTGRLKRENIEEALFIATKNGFIETVNEILWHGDSYKNVTDDLGNTLVLIAADNDKVDMVKLLVESHKADITIKNNLLESIYDMAMRQPTPEVLKYLMQHSQSDVLVQPVYLHAAAAAGDLDKMNFILDYDKVRLLDIDSNNNTIFHTAAAYNAHNVLDHFLKKDDDFTDLQNKDRDSALHLAVRKGHLESFNVLMEKNARIDLEDGNVQNALHAAVSSTTSNPDIVEKLVEKMKQTYLPLLNSQDRDGNTALHLAAKYSKADLIELLSDLDPEVENQDGETPLHSAVRYGTIKEVETIIDKFYNSKKTNIDHKDELGHSALFISAENGDAEMFELLLSKGADMTLRNNAGCTLLHKIVDNNRTNLSHSDKYIGVFYKIVKWSVKWYCRKAGLRIPFENTKPYFEYQLKAVRYLTNELYYEDCNVIQYAAKQGTGDLLKAILRTPNVYKFTIESPLGNDKQQCNSPSSQKDRMKCLGDYLQFRKDPNEVLYDVSYLIPSTKPKQLEPNHLEINIKSGTKLANQPASFRPPGQMTSCLEYIVQTNNEDYINDVLDDEPFKFLVSKYWTLCRRGYEVLMWTHVLYMILFTYFIMPSREYLHYRFNQPLNESSSQEEEKDNHERVFIYTLSFFWLFLIWPVFILLYEIVLGIYFVTSLKHSHYQWKKGLFGKLKIGEITSGLMRLPIGIMLFVFDNLSHISSLTFGFSTLGWFFMASFTDNPHNYLECLAIVLIFGWLHTINYVKGFKDWNALASILKHILIKDITCFIYIFIFVLISFGYAMHVLIQADYNLSTDSRQSTSTVYLTFYRMLSPGNILDISESADYKNSGGRVYVLRAVCAAYSVLSTVVLMNLLIAMMNSTYSEIKSNKSTAWRIDSLKLALWIERHVHKFLMRKVLKFKTFYDTGENRWMLVKTTEIDKDVVFWNDVETSKDGDKISKEEMQARDNQKKMETAKILSSGIENLNTQMDEVRNELNDNNTDSRLIKNMVMEMKMEMKRIHELCLETCTLAKMNKRLDDNHDKK